MISTKTKGLTELKQRLGRLVEDNPAIVVAALDGNVHHLVDAIRSRAPVSSGALRDSIHYAKSEDSDRRTLDVKFQAGVIEADVFYARFVEYGTMHAPAHPFIRPALDETAAEFEAAVAQSVYEQIKGVISGAVNYLLSANERNSKAVALGASVPVPGSGTIVRAGFRAARNQTQKSTGLKGEAYDREIAKSGAQQAYERAKRWWKGRK